MLERWLGIETNLSSGTKAGVATMAVGAMAASKMGGGARNFAVGKYNPVTGRRNQSGFNRLRNSVGSGTKVGVKGLRSAGSVVGSTTNGIRRGAMSAAGATAGTVAGTWNAMADRRAHGLKYREIIGQSMSATGRNVSRGFKETVKSGKEVVSNEFRNAGQSVKRDFSSSFGKGYTNSRDNVRDKILNNTGGAGRITPKGDTSNITPPTQLLPKKNSLDSDSRFQKFDAGEDGEL